MVEKMFNGVATAKGALIITPDKVIVTTHPALITKKYFKLKYGMGAEGETILHPFSLFAILIIFYLF